MPSVGVGALGHGEAFEACGRLEDMVIVTEAAEFRCCLQFLEQGCDARIRVQCLEVAPPASCVIVSTGMGQWMRSLRTALSSMFMGDPSVSMSSRYRATT